MTEDAPLDGVQREKGVQKDLRVVREKAFEDLREVGKQLVVNVVQSGI